MQKTSNHKQRDLESKEDLPTPPSPIVTPDLHIMMVMGHCIVLKQNDIMLKQF